MRAKNRSVTASTAVCSKSANAFPCLFFSRYEIGLLNRHPENDQERGHEFRMLCGESLDEKSRGAGSYVAEFMSPYGFERYHNE
jgi:hypothetical protein